MTDARGWQNSCSGSRRIRASTTSVSRSHPTLTPSQVIWRKRVSANESDSAESAVRADSKENGAIWWENAAIREAAFGNATEAQQAAAEGLKLDPGSQGVNIEAAIAYAVAGDSARAQAAAEDLNKRYPLDTQMQSLWLPAIQAQLALNRKDSAAALRALQPASPPIEYGLTLFAANISCLYPTYIRGQAYLAAGQGAQAAAEFQKFVDHSGVVWNCWTGALAKLGIARANALQAEGLNGCRGWCCSRSRSRRLQRFPHSLETSRSRHPTLQRSQG